MIPLLARMCATCFGLGYFPFASGTFTSLVAVLAYVLFPSLRDLSGMAFTVFCLTALGVWSGNVMEEVHEKDPSIVTIDELAGQWIALAGLPVAPLSCLLAFLFFRFFDIAKPGLVDRAQRLPGGWGIMVDDLLAGCFANLAVRAVFALAAFFQIFLPS